MATPSIAPDREVVLSARGVTKSYRMGEVDVVALRGGSRELGTTTAIITHNAPIADMAERVITLADGRIVRIEVSQIRKAAEELRW